MVMVKHIDGNNKLFVTEMTKVAEYKSDSRR